MICSKCGKNFSPVSNVAELCPECSMNALPNENQDSYGQSENVLPGYHYRANQYCPWEDEQQTGFFKGLLLTLRQSLFQPTKFFGQVSLHGGYKLPFLYALIIYSISMVAAYFFSAITELKSVPMGMPQNILFDGAGIGSLIYLFLVVTLEIFFKPVVLFLGLMVLGVKNSTLEGTFRISCYSSGPTLFNVIPVYGSFVAGIWEFVILVIGLREAFRISTGKAIMAILLPLVITVALILVILMLFLGRLFSIELFN